MTPVLFRILQKKGAQKILSRWHLIKTYIVNFFVSIFSVFQLKHLKKTNHPHTIALTSTPTVPKVAIQPGSSDDSFLRLDDSEIDFEDSPSNRSSNRSMGKLPESLIVNSTPLNHYNSHGSFRRGRMEISRTSLVWVHHLYCWLFLNYVEINFKIIHFYRFDDSDSHHGGSMINGHGITPPKRKKLFDCSDESDWFLFQLITLFQGTLNQSKRLIQTKWKSIHDLHRKSSKLLY